MGFIDDSLSVISGSKSHRRHSSRSHHKKKRSGSRSRSSSRGRGRGSGLGSIFGDNYKKHSSSKASLFSLGNDHNGSRSSFFNFGGKPSYYKRSSRQGFMASAYKKLKRLLRDLVHWAKRHPWKVFFMVLMPLISGGILTALLARFGLRLPQSLERLTGIASKAVSGDAAGLVGEAVRMASGGGAAAGAGAGAASVRVNQTVFDDGMAYRNEGETNWGDLTKGFSKMFL